jgi:DUF971 family protein
MAPLAPEPVRIELKRAERALEVEFETGEVFALSFELLRVFSPSAEVRGHSAADYTLQVGKRNVGVTRVEPQGNYAVVLYFDDGHQTGIYTWEWLYELGTHRDAMWDDYLHQLEAAGQTRDPS